MYFLERVFSSARQVLQKPGLPPGDQAAAPQDDRLHTQDVIWKLEDLYGSGQDEAIEADKEWCLKEAQALREAYKGRVAELGPSGLLELLLRLEALAERMGKISTYAYLNFSVNVTDPGAGAFLQGTREFLSQVNRYLVFFDLEWANVPDEIADRLMGSRELDHYSHYLKAARRYRPHLLSEAEEAIIVELSPVTKGSWEGLFEKVMTNTRYGLGKRSQEEVLSDLYSPDRNVRKQAAAELTQGLKKELLVTTHTFNTVLGEKMIEDRLRKYPKWISSMNLANELDDSTVDALVQAVTSRFDIVSRYYRLKAKLMGLETLFDYDRYAPLPFFPTRTITWPEARETVLGSFNRFSPDMASIAGDFFEKKWIHAPVLPQKTSGAFAHPAVPSVHPYVLVNFTGNFRDVETLAHELGHGVHQVLASSKGYFNSHTPLTLAETASVFAEMLVFKDLVRSLKDPRERLSLIASKVESVFATVFRQVAMNRFEDAIHRHRREKGELSSDDFSRLWLETQSRMFGESVILSQDYGVWWSYISHFVHTPGYVYAYAFGELLVLSLYGLYEEGHPGFQEKYMDLLSAGGSQTPYELLAPFGVDLKETGFWLGGLGQVEALVGEVEELSSQLS